jgi:hypothetical protein
MKWKRWRLSCSPNDAHGRYGLSRTGSSYMGMTKSILVVSAASLAVLMLCRAPIVHAQDSEAETLRREVDQLKARLFDVESKLRNFESRAGGTTQASDRPASETEQRSAAQPSGSANSASPSPPISSYPAGWLRVGQGMTQAEITTLIGPGHKIFELDGSVVWYYAYSGGGVGSVFFDSTGHASSYQKPSVWRLW